MADYKMKVDSDDDSFVVVSVKDFYQIFSETDEDSAPENSYKGKGSESSSDVESNASSYLSDVDCDNHFDVRLENTFDMHQKLNDVRNFPAHMKCKEDMKVKDVVKDHALPFLPAKSLLRLRAVSKEWDKWITNPFLAHKQSYCFKNILGFFYQRRPGNPWFKSLDQYACGVPRPSLSFFPESVNIISSCNGLLLCQGRVGNNVYYVCNPVTKEWQLIPKSGYYHGDGTAKVLAFDPSVLNIGADYHIVCAVPSLGQPMICFDIYSSGTRSWRRSETDCIVLGSPVLKDNGFYMNGGVYLQTESDELLAFDLKNEFCGILSLPFEKPPVGVLTHMHGELCFIHGYKRVGNDFCLDIYGGMDMSLKRRFLVHFDSTLDRGYRVLLCINDMVIILIESALYSYHMTDQKVKFICRFGKRQYSYMRTRFLPYVNSLVSVGHK